jgi:hypothetical protein
VQRFWRCTFEPFSNQFAPNNVGYGFCRLRAEQLEVAGKGPLDFQAVSGPTPISRQNPKYRDSKFGQGWSFGGTGNMAVPSGNTVFSRNPNPYALWVALGQFIAIGPFSLRTNLNGQICRLGAAERRPLSIPCAPLMWCAARSIARRLPARGVGSASVTPPVEASSPPLQPGRLPVLLWLTRLAVDPGI